MMRNKGALFVLLFIILSLLAYLILNYEKDYQINKYLNTKTKQHTQNYHALYKKYKEISTIIFQTKINTKSVQTMFFDQNRDKLYRHLKDTYSHLKQYNIKQLHFHLKNNDSFLRFHRPAKYGDNLTDIRETVKYVNENKKYIDGFEEGRIYNGYRFIFPMFYENNHIGSVEISFSTLAMNFEFMNNYDVISNFFISKQVVDKKIFKEEKKNYKRSPFKDFYLEKKAVTHVKKRHKLKSKTPLSQEVRDKVSKELNNKKSFSIYDTNNKIVITFIKIQNPVTKNNVGMFSIGSSASYIHSKTRNFYVSVIIIIIFIAVILYFTYKESMYKENIQQNNQKLEYLNDNLQREVDTAIEDLRLKDAILSQQSKLAAMGEMIDSIAHQWMQPIGVIKMRLQMLEMNTTLGNLTDEKVLEAVQSSDNQIEHLTNTINEFRKFFRPNNNIETISIESLIESTIILLKDDLIKHDIKIDISGDTASTLKVNASEFKHTIINIINNAKDAFIDNSIDTSIRIIKFDAETKNNKLSLKISDNAGGIPSEIIDDIFKPNFTTKEEGKGTGIGLYMTKQIIEKNNGTIEVENINNGACFKIII
jgi:signal transduction histidine kinase